jgi:hypothetical protein
VFYDVVIAGGGPAGSVNGRSSRLGLGSCRLLATDHRLRGRRLQRRSVSDTDVSAKTLMA